MQPAFEKSGKEEWVDASGYNVEFGIFWHNVATPYHILMLRDLKLALRTIQNRKCADADGVVAEYFTLSDNGELKHL